MVGFSEEAHLGGVRSIWGKLFGGVRSIWKALGRLGGTGSASAVRRLVNTGKASRSFNLFCTLCVLCGKSSPREWLVVLELGEKFVKIPIFPIFPILPY